MKPKKFLEHEINGLIISTVKIKQGDYETLVFDKFGNELKELHAHYKKEAEHNHIYCVSHYVTKRNCIHAI